MKHISNVSGVLFAIAFWLQAPDLFADHEACHLRFTPDETLWTHYDGVWSRPSTLTANKRVEKKRLFKDYFQQRQQPRRKGHNEWVKPDVPPIDEDKIKVSVSVFYDEPLAEVDDEAAYLEILEAEFLDYLPADGSGNLESYIAEDTFHFVADMTLEKILELIDHPKIYKIEIDAVESRVRPTIAWSLPDSYGTIEWQGLQDEFNKDCCMAFQRREQNINLYLSFRVNAEELDNEDLIRWMIENKLTQYGLSITEGSTIEKTTWAGDDRVFNVKTLADQNQWEVLIASSADDPHAQLDIVLVSCSSIGDDDGE